MYREAKRIVDTLNVAGILGQYKEQGFYVRHRVNVVGPYDTLCARHWATILLEGTSLGTRRETDTMDNLPASGQGVGDETAGATKGTVGNTASVDASPCVVVVVDLDGRIVQRTQDFRLVTRDGPFEVQWSANTLTSPDGIATGTIFVGTDISRYKRAEREAVAERERYQAILDMALDGVIMTNDEGMITAVNRSAESMFGYATADLVGQHLSILIPSLCLEKGEAGDVSATSMESLLGEERELEACGGDGIGFPCSLSLARIRGGESTTYCGYVRDLTETRRQQEQLRQALKMEAVGRLASGIAHDFNNLLMGLSGCASVAMECADSGRPNQLYLSEIKKAAASGTAMTKQLLAFGRKAQLQSVVFDIDARISAQHGLLRRLLGADIELVVSLQTDNALVRADLGQVDQVLMNLVANARDAMPHGGRLIIETSVALIAEGDSPHDHGPGLVGPGEQLAAGEYVAIRVMDSGCGMSSDTRDRVFEPFYTTKEPGRGTGLGLATVSEIVREWGGRIHLNSAEGEGTVFEILVPICTDAKPSQVAPREFDRPITNETLTCRRTILLCEDDRLVRMTVRYYLEAAGYTVLKAECGADAIETCRRAVEPIDLLLTDVVLPDQSGECIANEVRKICPDTKVLYMSAHTQEWLHSEGRVEQALETLQKPFDSAFLLDRIVKVLEPDSDVADLGAILVVEDSHAARLAIVQCLRDEGWSVKGVANGSEARELLAAGHDVFDILLVDYSLPDTKGNQLAAELQAAMPKIAIAYMSGYPELSLDPPGPLLVKPIEFDELCTTMRSLMEPGGSGGPT